MLLSVPLFSVDYPVSVNSSTNMDNQGNIAIEPRLDRISISPALPKGYNFAMLVLIWYRKKTDWGLLIYRESTLFHQHQWLKRSVIIILRPISIEIVVSILCMCLIILA